MFASHGSNLSYRSSSQSRFSSSCVSRWRHFSFLLSAVKLSTKEWLHTITVSEWARSTPELETGMESSPRSLRIGRGAARLVFAFRWRFTADRHVISVTQKKQEQRRIDHFICNHEDKRLHTAWFSGLSNHRRYLQSLQMTSLNISWARWNPQSKVTSTTSTGPFKVTIC